MKSKNWAMKRSYDGQKKHINKYEYKYEAQSAGNSGPQYHSQYPPHYYPALPPQQHNALHYGQMVQNGGMYSSPPPMWPMRPLLQSHSSQQLPYTQSIHIPPPRLSSTGASHPPLDPSTSSHNNTPLVREPFSRSRSHTPPIHQTFSNYPSESPLLARSRQNPSQIHAPSSQSPFSASQSPGESYMSESLDTNSFYAAKAKSAPQSVKKKKVAIENTTAKEWKREDALKAVALEERFCKRNSNPPTLILRFPDPQLDRDIVKRFSPFIEGVHFQQNAAPRFCFVRLKSDADVEKTIEELSNIPFGTGFITAEMRRVVTKQPSSTNIERVDPYSLYIGNLPRTVTVANVKESFPGAQRYDVGHSQKTWPSQYAFVRYRTPADAMRAFALSVNKTIDSRSLVIRFRRTKNCFVPEEPLSEDHVALINEVVNAEIKQFEEMFQCSNADTDPALTQHVLKAASSSHCSDGSSNNLSLPAAEPTSIDKSSNLSLNGDKGTTTCVASVPFVDQAAIKQEPSEEEDSSASSVRLPIPVKEENNDIEEKLFEGKQFERCGTSSSLFTVQEKRSEIKSEFDDDSYDDDFMYESDEDFGIGNNNMAEKSGASLTSLQSEMRPTSSTQIKGQSTDKVLTSQEAAVLNKNEDYMHKVDTIGENGSTDASSKRGVYENSFVTSVVKHLTGVKQENVRNSASDISSGSNLTFCNKIFCDISDEMDSGGEIHSDSEFEEVNKSSLYKDVDNNTKMTIKEE